MTAERAPLPRATELLRVAAVYAVATVVVTWPLAAKIRSHLPAASHPTTYDDMLLHAWVLSWDVHALLHQPLRLFEANIFHPLRHTLAYSDALVSDALPLLPLAPLTPNPALLLNTALLLSFVIGASGAFFLVRYLADDRTAAFVAGLLFAFAPYRFWQIERLQALSVQWTPFLFLALHAFLARPGRARGAALAATFVLQALASVYVAYASAILVGIFLAAWLVFGPAGRVRAALAAVAVFAAASVVVAIVYLPHALVRDEMAFARPPLQLILHATIPVELGRAFVSMPRYLAAKVLAGQRGGGTLGFTATVLLAAAVCAGGRPARLYAGLALAALVFSFGPVVVLPWGTGQWVPGPYRLLYDWVPGFTALREPRRWTAFVVACGTVAAGLGASAIFRRIRDGRVRAVLGVVLLALIALEIGWRPLALVPAPVPGPRSALYATIASATGAGAVAELPIGADREEAIAMFRSAYHLRPLLDGYSGFSPTTADLRRRLRRFPDRRSVELLRRLGVRFVVYDTTRRRARAAPSLARRLAHADATARLGEEAAGAVLVTLVPLPAVQTALAPATELPRSAWRVRASAGDPGAAVDDDLATHWTSVVDPETPGGWYEVDFGETVTFDRLTVELDAHYGEFLRAWRVIAREGEREWTVAARGRVPAPLVSYRADPDHVVLPLTLPRTRARAIRIELPPLRVASRRPPFDLDPEYWGWSRWGIHELRVWRRREP